jgi:hypothetical protein
METTKVLIENWPNTPWFKEWIPIIIALIALITSIISLYWTSIEQTKSARPFVWASSYGVIDNVNKTIIPIPFRVGYRVKNSPARILQIDVDVYLDTNELFRNTERNSVQFPDESSEWAFTIGKTDFERIMNRPISEQSKLIRTISIKYSSLDGGKIYNYKLKQAFIPSDNQWNDMEVTSD